MYLIGSTILSPLGVGLEENVTKIIAGQSGIEFVSDATLSEATIPMGLIQGLHAANGNITRFDTLVQTTLELIQNNTNLDLSASEVAIVLSTTKGNIELLNSKSQEIKETMLLTFSANKIANQLKNPNKPYVISQACISGISAFIFAQYLLGQKKYKHVLIIGCDVLSEFVLSGFTSFHAISKNPCRPFDKKRDGITLGEACGIALVSNSIKSEIVIHQGQVTNDANHISGPSKTGEELKTAIEISIRNAGISAESIDSICAHGTATMYNDEMESKAIALSRLSSIPTYSLKGYFGHTLGASGVIETLLMAAFMKRGIIPQNINFDENGVEDRMCINAENQFRSLRFGLKTSAGFGGCNAALVIENRMI